MGPFPNRGLLISEMTFCYSLRFPFLVPNSGEGSFISASVVICNFFVVEYKLGKMVVLSFYLFYSSSDTRTTSGKRISKSADCVS